jgi:sugar transferase (PEP-CTERM/EpsH1 system associated)
LQQWLESRVGIRADRITRVCNGVNATRFSPAADALAARREVLPPDFAPDGTIVFMWVGRMEPVKDPLLMVEGFAHMASAGSLRERVRLVMVGNGSLESAVRKRLEERGIAALTWLPGPRANVPELLRAADVYALTSLNEGISNTILEAMASGLPVIATNVGGNPELVSDQQTGALVPSGQADLLARAMTRYVEDTGLRRAHAQAARTLVLKEFTLERMVERYLALYDELLAGHSRH